MATVAQFMTPHPFTIGHDIPLAKAHQMMRLHHVRHLPVLDGGKLVGVVSQRDLYFLETLTDVDVEKVSVEEAMTAEPFCVSEDAELSDVAEEMAKRRIGTALVTEGDRLVGIFTAVDALRALVAARRS